MKFIFGLPYLGCPQGAEYFSGVMNDKTDLRDLPVKCGNTVSGLCRNVSINQQKTGIDVKIVFIVN